jgi:hypothetical protein
VLAGRVDALTIAFRTETAPTVASAALSHAVDDVQARVSLEMGSTLLELAATRVPGRWKFENGDLHGVIDQSATGGWSLEISARASYLGTTSLEDATATLKRVASGFGWQPSTATDERGRPETIRLRRVDLAVDVGGWDMNAMRDSTGAHLPLVESVLARAGVQSFTGDVPDGGGIGATRQYLSRSRSVTGITVGAGGSVMARIYDKRAEVERPESEAKAAMEHAIWRQAGWDGNACVTRVEFQVRGEALDEFKLRDPDALPERIDGLWAYLAGLQGANDTGKRSICWLRLVDPSTATRRSRADVLPIWRTVAAHVFRHRPTAPADRSRVRLGGATPASAFGSVLSCVAGGAGGLEWVPEFEDGRLVPMYAQLERLGVDGPRAGVELLVRQTLDQFASIIVRDLARRSATEWHQGPLGHPIPVTDWPVTFGRAVRTRNAAVARFSREADRVVDARNVQRAWQRLAASAA